jgi:pilus assembly protein CpaE
MNAPWTPGRGAGVRDPFAAFVCDESTAEMLRPLVGELGWQAEKVNKGGLRTAIQTLSVSPSPTILFVDLSESGDPLNDINALAEVCEPGTLVIAAGQVNDVRLYRELIGSGIQDYLLKPFSQDQFRDALAAAQAALTSPRSSDAAKDKPRMTTAVIGTRGGAGASTIAGTLAWSFGEIAERSTALLDLDVHFGTGALALDLEPGRGLTDAIENPSRIDGLFIERAMVRANDRLAVLSAEAPINSPLMSDGAAYYQLQEELKAAFDSVVLDLPRSMMVQHPHLVADIQAAVIVTELTLAATRDAIRILSWLKSNAPSARVVVVANRVLQGQSEVSLKDFESSIERKVDIVVPLDSKLAIQAAKLGKPLAEIAKGSKLAAPLNQLATMLLEAANMGADSKTSGKKLLDKIGGLKSLIPSKKAKA